MIHARNFKDITGLLFTRWTVIAFDHRGVGGSYWKCRCACGVEKVLFGQSLKSGHSQSCGCLNKERLHERATHGATRGRNFTGAYNSWTAMKSRCSNPRNNRFAAYGGRGIKVCGRWINSFENFLADMGERPHGFTLERRDTDKSYSKSNCRWATYREQFRNTRSNHWIVINGIRKCVTDWADHFGINRKTVWSRIQYGYPEERLFEAVRRAP